MKLEIYSLKKILFKGEAVSINCKTKSGEITVLDNHRPLISILSKGVIEVADVNKEDHYIPVLSGFMEVKASNRVKLLVEEGV